MKVLIGAFAFLIVTQMTFISITELSPNHLWAHRWVTNSSLESE